MKDIFKFIYFTLREFGFDLIKFSKSAKGFPYYISDLVQLKKQKGSDTTFYFGKKYPVLSERFEDSGIMSGHYFHQDLFVARKIYTANPVRHVDIGSRTDGFVAHVAVFREIEIIDIRIQHSKVKNISFRQADLMQLPENMIDYCDSISALHSLEHFGLGRYGDPIDYFGYKKAIENISKIVKQGGKFYFSVPIGKQRIEFNAHRIFSVQYLLDLLKENGFALDSFSYVNDNGDFTENAMVSADNLQTNFGCDYGCGIFELTKKQV